MSEVAGHLDLGALNDLKEVMGDEFSLLIETFVDDSVIRINSINAAVREADPEAIRRAAHSFKGSASNMGAIQLCDYCRILEDLGHSGQTEGADRLYDEIVAEYAHVKSALEAL